MNRIYSVFLAAILTVNLAACGSDTTSETAPLQEYTIEDLSKSGREMAAAEKDLEKVGLKFSVKNDSESGVTTVRWDEAYLSSKMSADASITPAKMTPYLEKYLNAAEAMLRSFGGKFKLRDENGNVEAKTMKSEVRKELEARISVTKQTLDSIRSN